MSTEVSNHDGFETRKYQPAMKICALLVPKEMKVEHSNAVKLTDEQLEAMIEHLKISIEAQAGGPISVRRAPVLLPM